MKISNNQTILQNNLVQAKAKIKSTYKELIQKDPRNQDLKCFII